MSEARLNSLSPTSIGMEWRVGEIGGSEKMTIGGEYPSTPQSESLFHSMGLLHIVSPFLPELIATDFPVLPMAQLLTNELYKSKKRTPPEWKTPTGDTIDHSTQIKGNHSLVTFSGGKDSLWNLMTATEAGESPRAVHIQGLNEVVGRREHEDVLKQQKVIGFPLSVVVLKNSYTQKGQPSMQSRDLFLTAMAIPFAAEEGAGRIYLEGSFKEGASEQGAIFAHKLSTWQLYQAQLELMSIPIQMNGTNRGEIDSIKDLIEKQPSWLPLVSNCLAGEQKRTEVRKTMKSIAPSFPFYESQCGGCLKCMTLNLARIAYDPMVKRDAKAQDIKNYLGATVRWHRENKPKIGAYIDPGFEPLLASLL